MSADLEKIAVFASGSGTDFQSVIDANKKDPFCEIRYLIASKAGIGAVERAEREGIEARVFSSKDFSSLDVLYTELEKLLKDAGVKYVVLAGWLKIIPSRFVKAFEDRMINIHPSLIPSFCGEGFYGLRVHEAAINYGVKVSGCTVHFVDETPDGGAIIAQRAVEVFPSDTPEELSRRILKEEHELLPFCVRKLCEGKLKKDGRKVTLID
ncbi:MAG: phosphoribosylglycinamide formyltransferase [Clostridia bacterium]|nr:phosphoribosylglycinamide formyltransferase [Clostridia bacterium]